jgi:hypothetical protein
MTHYMQRVDILNNGRYDTLVFSSIILCGRSVVFFGFLHQKTNRHDITEILLKVALNTITHLFVMAIFRNLPFVLVKVIYTRCTISYMF